MYSYSFDVDLESEANMPVLPLYEDEEVVLEIY